MKKTALVFATLIWSASLSYSTLPVIDYTAVANMIQQGLKQIQQYTTQLSQLQTEINTYEHQILQATGIAQAAQIYSQVQSLENQVVSTVNMFRNGGGLQGYIQNAQDVNYWLSASNAAYTGNPGSYWSTTQKTANDQMVNLIAQEEKQIDADTQLLSQLQSQSRSAGTQRAALDVANELSSLQQKQLMEIRTLMVSEQQTLAARNASTANGEAMTAAQTQTYFGTQLGTQNHTGW
jgi:P-type conjugative transfer protein TrbJ